MSIDPKFEKSFQDAVKHMNRSVSAAQIVNVQPMSLPIGQLSFSFVPSGAVKLIAKRLMIEDGLLGIVEPCSKEKIQEALDTLSPEERRATVRRFRKARRVAYGKWRKSNRDAPEPTKDFKYDLVSNWYLQKAKEMVECAS